MKRRTRKEQRQDSQEHYGGLAEKEPDGKAAQRFVRKAYSSYGKTEKVEVLEMTTANYGKEYGSGNYK